MWPGNDLIRPGVHPLVKNELVLEATRGQTPQELGVYDSARRLIIDREITDRSIDFMRQNATDGRPFFLYVPYTQTHWPVEPHPDYAGKTGNGRFADVLAQTDAYVGELLDTINELRIRDNTVFIFTADNGPEGPNPASGFLRSLAWHVFHRARRLIASTFLNPLAGQHPGQTRLEPNRPRDGCILDFSQHRGWNSTR